MTAKKKDSKPKKIKRLPEPGGLTFEQSMTVLNLLVEYEERMDLVKEEFESMTEKPITVETIMQVRRKYGEKIAELQEQIAERIKKNPLSKLHFRMKMMYRLLKEALKERVIRSYKVGIDEYDQEKAPDYKSAAIFIEKVDNMVNNAKKLELEEQKMHFSQQLALLQLRKKSGEDIDDEIDELLDGGSPEEAEEVLSAGDYEVTVDDGF